MTTIHDLHDDRAEHMAPPTWHAERSDGAVQSPTFDTDDDAWDWVLETQPDWWDHAWAIIGTIPPTDTTDAPIPIAIHSDALVIGDAAPVAARVDTASTDGRRWAIITFGNGWKLSVATNRGAAGPRIYCEPHPYHRDAWASVECAVVSPSDVMVSITATDEVAGWVDAETLRDLLVYVGTLNTHDPRGRIGGALSDAPTF